MTVAQPPLSTPAVPLTAYLAQLRPTVGPVYRAVPKAFCAWLERHDLEPERTSVDRWLDGLRKEHQSAGTIRLKWRILSRLFKANQLPWPYKRREGPKPPQELEEDRPIADVEIVEDLIRASMKLQPAHRALLAMSTTYGTRRQEISLQWNESEQRLEGLGPDSFDWKRKLVYVVTAKSGRQRYHLIPDEILPFLQAYDWGQRPNDRHQSPTHLRRIPC